MRPFRIRLTAIFRKNPQKTSSATTTSPGNNTTRARAKRDLEKKVRRHSAFPQIPVQILMYKTDLASKAGEFHF
jgi:hypothetical protein